MICDNCKIERLERDFLKNQKFCYHCELQKKLEKISENKTEKKVVCRRCGNQIKQDKSLKKRQRSVFCSKECAQEGHKELNNNHWTRIVRFNLDI